MAGVEISPAHVGMCIALVLVHDGFDGLGPENVVDVDDIEIDVVSVLADGVEISKPRDHAHDHGRVGANVDRRAGGHVFVRGAVQLQIMGRGGCECANPCIAVKMSAENAHEQVFDAFVGVFIIAMPEHTPRDQRGFYCRAPLLYDGVFRLEFFEDHLRVRRGEQVGQRYLHLETKEKKTRFKASVVCCVVLCCVVLCCVFFRLWCFFSRAWQHSVF